MQTRPNSEANNSRPGVSTGQNGSSPTTLAPNQVDGASQSSITQASQSRPARAEAFDQPIVLKQTPLWSRAILWGIVGVVTFGFAWACLAKVEEAVQATGELKPQGAVYELQPPVAGKVAEVLVEDGDTVSKGQPLVRLDPSAAEAERESLAEVGNSLVAENNFYKAQLSGAPLPASDLGVDIPAEVLNLTASRRALLEENQLYAALIQPGGGASLDIFEQGRLNTLQAEVSSRINAAELEIAGLREQLLQTEQQIVAATETLAIEEGILGSITELEEKGGIARVQVRQQEVETISRRAELNRLLQEKEVLLKSIDQATQQRDNTRAASASDILNRMAENKKRLAEIDSELNKRIVENEKRIAEIRSQVEQTDLQLEYQVLKAPIDGVVFDLQAQDDGFITTNPNDPVLKIVPGDALVAEIYITNKDIGFVDVGMPVDVRIDTFPFSEFGDVEGELTSIGADALPPTEVRQFYSFPAKVNIDQQYVNINGNPIDLQSGMSITANVKTRKRRVITLFTDLFVQKIESLKTR
ncbi:MAG: HlyD family efflux transporter periplasmic adaptor subunit [Elainellaceae cyanobacterium]